MCPDFIYVWALENTLKKPNKGEITMGSNSKQTKLIRARKTAPNKANQKADQKRIQKNMEILKELAEKDKA